MMGRDGVNDRLAHTEFLGKLSANLGMFTLDFVRDGFADVVQERSGLGYVDVSTDFLRNHASNMRHFNGVQEDVLAVTSTEFEFTQEMEEFFWNANNTNFASGIFAGTNDLFFDFALCFGDGFFD